MYIPENFAQVIDTQHVENPETLKKRKAYVEYQLRRDFLMTLFVIKMRIHSIIGAI
jgi:hypothetical protein